MYYLNFLNPVNVFLSYLNYDEEYLKRCREYSLNVDYPNSYETNVKAKMSTWQIFNETDLFDPILNDIMCCVRDSRWHHEGWDGIMNMKIQDCWISIYEKGDKTIPHDHDPSFLSFVYYLSVDDESSGKLVFDELNYEIQPSNNLLVMFPSSVKHSVKTILNDQEKRIILAGNIEYERRM